MTTAIGVVIAIICFMLLIIGHEGGHFFAGKAMGMQINEFSCGMGPLLWHTKKGETQYSLRAIPIGGYCAFEGENEDSDNPRAFVNNPWWAKIVVLLAGPFTNIVIGILIFTLLFTYIGFSSTTIGQVVEGCPAEAAGVLAGDEVIAVDGVPVSSWTEVYTKIAQAEGDKVALTVLRNSEKLNIECGTYTNEYGNKAVGIITETDHNFIKAFKSGVKETAVVFESIAEFFRGLFNGTTKADDVTGVVGIVAIIGQSYNYGLVNVIYIIAIISANLGYMNLLPFPALDGGRILTTLINKITGGKFSTKAEAIVNTIGMVILLLLMVFMIFKDTINLIK